MFSKVNEWTACFYISNILKEDEFLYGIYRSCLFSL